MAHFDTDKFMNNLMTAAMNTAPGDLQTALLLKNELREKLLELQTALKSGLHSIAGCENPHRLVAVFAQEVGLRRQAIMPHATNELRISIEGMLDRLTSTTLLVARSFEASE